MIFTSSGSYILGLTSAGAAAGAGIASLIYFMKIRKLYPDELLKQKKEMENSLIELLKKNHFSVDNCKTGELYEILFQYFEDFINYRDISYELSDLKKKISNSASLTEKEKKQKQFSDEIEDINLSIDELIENLELSIHPKPGIDSIDKTIHEIDELFEENENEINEKQSLIIKFNEEIEQYDKAENSELSLDFKLEETLKQINECSENIEHVKFLNSVFNEAGGIWSLNRLEELSRITLDRFSELTGNSFIREDIAETINNILLTSGVIKSEHKGLKKYIAFSIKAALSEMLMNGDLPPVFIINPFTADNEFAENMKKLLPDLFPERQVVIIIPVNEPDLKGNLITL
jgi:methyl-accepting chemotaxis protein